MGIRNSSLPLTWTSTLCLPGVLDIKFIARSPIGAIIVRLGHARIYHPDFPIKNNNEIKKTRLRNAAAELTTIQSSTIPKWFIHYHDNDNAFFAFCLCLIVMSALLGHDIYGNLER